MIKRSRLLREQLASSFSLKKLTYARVVTGIVSYGLWSCSLVGPLDVERQDEPNGNVPGRFADKVEEPTGATAVPEPVNGIDRVEEATGLNDQVPLVSLSGSNLISNSDLERDLSGWSAPYGGVLTVTSEQAHTGTQSLKVSGRTEVYQGAHFDLTTRAEAGAVYDVRVFALLGGSAVDNLILTAVVGCEGVDEQFVTIATGAGSDVAWSELRGLFTMPGAEQCQAELVRVYVEGPAPGVDLYVDDLEVVLSSPEEPIDFNLVSNPGFEDGVQDWVTDFGGRLSATSDVAHTGSQSAVVTERTFAYQGPQYDLTAEAANNSTYSVRAFARPSTGVNVPLNLTSRVQCEGQEDLFLSIVSALGSSDSWSELDGTLSLPARFSCTILSVLVYVEGPEPGIDLYVDDVSIERGVDNPDVLNLIRNSGFESGVDDWTAAFGGTLTTTTSTAHSGGQSALVRGRTLESNGLHLDISSLVEAGATYTLSAFARVSGTATDNIVATVRERCSGLADEFVQIDLVEGSKSKWTLIGGDVVIPSSADCSGGEFLLYFEGPQSGVDLLVDDVFLVRAEAT